MQPWRRYCDVGLLDGDGVNHLRMDEEASARALAKQVKLAKRSGFLLALLACRLWQPCHAQEAELQISCRSVNTEHV